LADARVLADDNPGAGTKPLSGSARPATSSAGHMRMAPGVDRPSVRYVSHKPDQTLLRLRIYILLRRDRSIMSCSTVPPRRWPAER